MNSLFYGNAEENDNVENPSFSGVKPEEKKQPMASSTGGTYGMQ
jgi:hypothetical protein